MYGEVKDSEQIKQYSQARQSRDPRFDGHFFVAVISTGIFCRPVCPARLPGEINVRYYLHAAQAAHAGFRPCLRCRPDSAPLSPAWLGVASTVQRAERLLSEIPPQPVSKIACRLGVSPRYLHRLMSSRVGMPPVVWQKYQQLLFAKRLLQQSSLSVEDVAVASGFNSARRLQITMKKYWKLTPSQCRGHVKNAFCIHRQINMTVYFRAPYHWPFVRDFLAVRAIPGTEDVTTSSYRRIFSSQNCQGVIEATYQGSKNAFAVTLTISNLSAVRQIVENLTRVLDLHADPQVIEAALARAGIPQSRLCEGIRLPGVWSAFEAGCRAILGQQVSVKAAMNNLMKLVQHLGEETDSGRAFPSPKRVADDPLTFLKMPEVRKQALRNLAVYFNDIGDERPEERDLLALKGIGPWTADYLMMRGESEPDRFLGSDLVVRKMSEQFPVNDEVAAPWRSYLTLQLWQLANERTAKAE